MQKTILLVDDEDANLELLQKLLKDDYALVCAKNGPKALVLAAQQPDLILLDIMMPGMDGYEVCRRLKANERTKNIPVILVASKREMSDEIDGLKIGASDYIAKPLAPLEVKARVKTYLALQAAAQPDQDAQSGCTTCLAVKGSLSRLQSLAENLLKESTLAAEHRKVLLAMHNESFHAQSLLHLSLTVLPMEQGNYPLQAGNLDLLALIRSVRTQLEPLIRSKKLTLKVQLQSKAETEKNVFIVRGEKMLCYLLFFNLIRRALEAAPNDQVVTLSMEDTSKSGIIRIHDPGIIAAGLREQFFAKESHAGKPPAGIGLDAYTAKLLTEIQGGRIRMRVDEAKGTEIVFSLPKGETSE
ncbi:MAG: hybrid sensor histidine kinase/response regulator [Magnetococcales bacterium]|nr:hybrid sensor histidine kinase/response regulator [Magnetococcales bacterium]